MLFRSLPKHANCSDEVSTVPQLVGSSLADPFEAPREDHAHHKDDQKYDLHGEQPSNCRVLARLLANLQNGGLEFGFHPLQSYPLKERGSRQ